GYGEYLRHYSQGLQFILPILLCTLGGNWLGRKYDMATLFTLLGLALGFAVGFWSLYKELYGLGPGVSGSEDSDEDGEDDRPASGNTEL
ncbi:MAG: hypothetical protein CMJ99_04270, partial [Planctomycetes bacterium]|nr:hypothetical protein [Planctomycetota bacterium]